MSSMSESIDGMAQGREWGAMGDDDAVRTLLGRVYDERYHGAVPFGDRNPEHQERCLRTFREVLAARR